MGWFNHKADHHWRLARWTPPRSHLWWRGDRAIWISVAIEMGKRKKKKTQGALEDTPKTLKTNSLCKEIRSNCGHFFGSLGYLPRACGQNHWPKQGSNNRKTHPQTSNWEIFPGLFSPKNPGFSRLLGWTFAAALRQTLAPRWDVGRGKMPRHVFSIYIYMFISSLGTRLLQDECLLQKKSNLYTLFYISYNFHICDMTESFDSQVCCFREPSRLLDP